MLDARHTLVSLDLLPDDRAIPGLQLLADQGWLNGALSSALGRAIQDVIVTMVKYKPGRRITIRLNVQYVEEKGSPETQATFYAKARYNKRGCTIAHILQSLSSGEHLRGGPFIPQLVAYWPEAQTLVQSAVPGESLEKILASPLANQAAHDCGTALRLFHQLPAELPDAHGVAQELATLRRTLEPWRNGLPGEEAGQTTDLLRQLERDAPTGHMSATLHRDCYPEQMLWSRPGAVGSAAIVGMVDLDEVSHGDPALDVGNMLAHLCLWHLERGGEAVPGEAGDEFMRGYGGHEVLGANAEGRLDWYTGASLLRLAALHGVRPGKWDMGLRLLDAACGQAPPRLVHRYGRITR